MKKIISCFCLLFTLGTISSVQAANYTLSGVISSIQNISVTLNKPNFLPYTAYRPSVLGNPDYLKFTNVVSGVGTSIHAPLTVMEGNLYTAKHNASYGGGTKMYIACQPRDLNANFPVSTSIEY